MSAIFGLVHLDERPVAAEELACMDAALAMYGLDGSGQWRQGAIGLGQRLLYVTPEDAFEQQPHSSADGQVCMVSDGRIDNRPELIEELRIGVPASELPDGAIILHAYERWGRDCVHHLTGAFTFALWDARLQQLLVVRSVIASPSLFIHATARTLAFATMPKGLFALPFIARAMDEQYLADYLARTGTEPVATFYSHVKRLLPGQMLLVQGERWSVEEFWKPDMTRKIHFVRDEEYVEAFCELFDRIVQDYLRSQSPAGVMMSGGLDSTTVAAVAARRYRSEGKRLATFTEVPRAGFDGAIIRGRYTDETPYVQALARQQPNLDLNLIQTDGQVYIDEVDSLFAASEMPFPNASNRVWYEAILQAAQAQGVRVLLIGSGGNATISWGGDGLLSQLIGAGHWVQAWQEARALTRRGNARSPLGSLFMNGILPYLPDWCYLAVNRLRTLGHNDVESTADWRRRTPIRPEFAVANRVDERARSKKLRPPSRPSPDTRSTRLNGLLSSVRRGDGLAAGYQARYGVTLRDPTSDPRLAEFCLALPESQYQRDGSTRWLVRRAMAEQLPAEVLANRGRGLQAADWYERLYNARGRILEELARIEKCDLACRALDLPRLRSMVEEMDTKGNGARQQMREYRVILERGLMTGSFIRWVEGGARLARWHYGYAGLSIASELCLPEWQPFQTEQPAHAPDVEIRLEPATEEVYTRLLNAEEYRFHIEAIGQYWVQGGRLIRIAMDPSAGLRETRLFLLGSAWGALCYQRGLLTLHASVVEVNGQAVAFCGVSGAGKSSIAATLVAQGYRLIADDLCHVDMSGTKPGIYPAAARLKLWQDALGHLGWESDDLERDHFRMDKFHIDKFHIDKHHVDRYYEPKIQGNSTPGQGVLRESEVTSPIPLRAIYLLGWGEVEIKRLTGLKALRQLIESATYRGELLEPMGELAAHWQRCTDLARNVPIFRFTRPADWSAMTVAMQSLILMWQV